MKKTPMYSNIQDQLNRIENEHNVEILYAIESGSRGWGFFNCESDYDIRFIFKRPLNDYLTINPPKDTIDYFEGKLDFVGWDIKKALFLHRKSNPNLREWIKQKTVYRGDCDFLKDLPPFNPITLKHHYASIAYNNWKRYVVGNELEMTKKSTKIYLYCIRCILTWILIDEGVDAPLEISELMKLCSKKIEVTLYKDIELLIKYYQSNCSENILNIDSIENLVEFITEKIKMMKTNDDKSNELPDAEIYNERFRKIIMP